MLRNMSFNKYRDITEYANKQIDRVRSNYIWLASLLTIISVVGAGLIAFLSYQNIHDLRKDMLAETDRIASSMNSRLDLITDRLKFDMEKEVYLVEREVRERINSEFDRENIKELVEKAATEKIGYYTEALIRDRINEEVQPLIQKTRDSIKALNNKVLEINNTSEQRLAETKSSINNLVQNTRRDLDSIQTISDLVFAIASAQAADRDAWDKLKRWANDKNYQYSKMAYDAYEMILDNYSNIALAETFIDTIKWTVDPSKLTLEKIKENYAKINNRNNYYSRLQLIDYIWQRKDYKLKDKLEFLIYIIKNDKDLRCLRQAGIYLDQYANDSKMTQIKFLATDYFIDWWEKNKSKYK